jgi:bifunctional non-homologous end joining protein LigD
MCWRDRLGLLRQRYHHVELRLVKEPFDHPDYIFELKHDGFRAITYIQNGECKILSRNSNQLRFKSLKENLARLPVQDAGIVAERKLGIYKDDGSV